MSSSEIAPLSPMRPKKPVNPNRNKPSLKSPTRSPALRKAVPVARTATPSAAVDASQNTPHTHDDAPHTRGHSLIIPDDPHPQRIIHDLTEQLHQLTAKNCEDLYWLNLELDTLRQEKQQLQDRLDAYALAQEQGHLMDESHKDDSVVRPSRPLPTTPEQVRELVHSLDKQERMVRLLHNQVSLVRSSGDAMVKTYKDQLAALMTEKTQAQVQWMNQLSELERERDHLRVKLQAAEQMQLRREGGTENDAAASVASRRSGGGQKQSQTPQEETSRLKNEVSRLKKENSKLQSDLQAEKRSARMAMEQANHDRKDLSTQIQQQQAQIAVLQSTSVTAQMLEQMKQDREEAIETIDHVAAVWEKADSSIQQLEGIIQVLSPENQRPSEEQEQVLSAVETTALVYSQIKVSLMLIELKLRNNLTCLQNDKLYMGIKPDDEALLARLDSIQDDAMTAIEQVQAALDDHLAKHEDATEYDEDDTADEDDEYLADDNTDRRRPQSALRRLSQRQSLINDVMSEYFDDENDCSREEVDEDGKVHHFVHTKVLGKIQDEVMHALGSLQEKTAEIVRLKATVEELTVRERSLMFELRRVMGEQARIEAAERQRRMEAMKALDTDDDDEPTSDGGDNDNGSGYASSIPCSDDDYDEISYYEEVIED